MTILKNISEETYNNMPELRNSDLAKMKKSYLHYTNREMNERTDSMEFGSAFHCFLLEESVFFERYAVAPEGLDRRTKEGKSIWSDLQNCGKSILKHDDYMRIQWMKKSVLEHPKARSILMTSENEGVYTGEIEGVPAKCKVDIRSRGYTFDIKTCQDASAQEFVRSIEKYDYHRQGAFYDQLVSQNGIESKGFGIIAVESQFPFMVGVYLLDRASLMAGEDQAKRLIGKLKFHIENPNAWAGYSAEIETIGIRQWKIDEEAREESSQTGT